MDKKDKFIHSLFTSKLYVDENLWLNVNGFKYLNNAYNREFPSHTKINIAEKNINGGRIVIEACFMPAHFFSIKISKNGRKVTFSTGSGSLKDYMEKLYPIILSWFENMIDIEVEKNE